MARRRKKGSRNKRTRTRSHKHTGTITVQHRRDNRKERKFWDIIEFGIPLFVISFYVFYVLSELADPSNPLIFIAGAAVSIYLSLKARNLFSKFNNKIADYLNKY